MVCLLLIIAYVSWLRKSGGVFVGCGWAVVCSLLIIAEVLD